MKHSCNCITYVYSFVPYKTYINLNYELDSIKSRLLHNNRKYYMIYVIYRTDSYIQSNVRAEIALRTINKPQRLTTI